MLNDDSADLGPRGLVIYGNGDPTKFQYVTETAWRELDSYAVEGISAPFDSLVNLNVALARLDQGVFVNLDQLKNLELTAEAQAAQANAPTKQGAVTLDEPLNVVLKEGPKLYVIPSKAWSQADVVISGDAGVLINRDAVLAPIPRNPLAEGTFCILVNLAALT